MKFAIKALAVTSLLTPMLVFAQQSNAPLTRADVFSELVQLEKAGYKPIPRSLHYPEDIQRALTRIHDKKDAMAPGGM